MQVILLQRVEKLGLMGEVVKVKPGYARNYLLPQKMAIRASKDNIAYFEQQKASYEARNLKHKEEAQKIAKKVEGAVVTLIRQASESGQLYGSVRPRDIAEDLTRQGFVVDKNQVAFKEPIKTLGLHSVDVVLHPEVRASITLNIALSEEEAAVQIQASKKETETKQNSPIAESAE